jgi:TRAP-type C4-dicarboxylate transport system permease small subunit
MGIMIFLGMPLVTAAREHLVVDFTSNILSTRMKRIQQVIVNLFALVTFLMFSYLLWFHGLGLAEDFIATDDFEIELAPLAFLLAIMCILTIFVLLNHILTDLFSKSPSYSTLKSKENYAAKSFAKNEDKSKRPQRIWK